MFSINAALKFGWEKFKANLGLSLGATLLVLALGALGEIFDRSFILILVLVIVSVVTRIGYTKIFLKMADGESPVFKEIFEHYNLFWKFLGTAILTALAVMGGFILLIIPGIIFGLKFSFAQFITVD